jgi:hypothetical protein
MNTKRKHVHDESPSAVPLSPDRNERPVPEQPSPDAIAVRAYELYVARGCSEGCDLDDWLQAERELRGTDGST